MLLANLNKDTPLLIFFAILSLSLLSVLLILFALFLFAANYLMLTCSISPMKKNQKMKQLFPFSILRNALSYSGAQTHRHITLELCPVSDSLSLVGWWRPEPLVQLTVTLAPFPSSLKLLWVLLSHKFVLHSQDVSTWQIVMLSVTPSY